jgi:hypothetical protein
VATAVDPPLHADRYGAAVLVPGVVGVLVLAGALAFAQPAGIPIAVVLLGGSYGGSLFLGPHALDVWAPLEATGLLLAAELAYWSLELRPWVEAEPGVLARRATILTATGAGALFVGATVLGSASAPVGGGVAWEAVGVAAAAGALALLVRLSRRTD